MTHSPEVIRGRPGQPDAPVAIVTGAGGGVGRAICVQLAAHGFRIVGAGRTLESVQESMCEAGLEGPNSLAIHADLGEVAGALLVADRALDHFGRIDVLVNNAGIAALHPLSTSPDELLERHMNINFYGPFRLIRRLWPTFNRQGFGRIINVTSMSTIDPFPGLAAYAASKSALESLTRSIRNEGAEAGIEAWSIAPGAIETAMLRSIVNRDALPESLTLAPAAVAAVVVECATGRRADEAGSTILIPSPA